MKAAIAFLAGAVVAGSVVYVAVRPAPPVPNLSVTPPPAPELPLEPEIEPEPEPQPAPKPRAATAPEKAPPPARRPAPRPFFFQPVIHLDEPAELPLPPKFDLPASATEPPRFLLAALPETPPPPEPNRVTIPAGKVFNVILAENLSSEKNFPGDEFVSTLDRPLVVDGFIIADRDARADGRVVEAKRAGKVKGASNLAIKLIRLHTSDGQIVDIETETFVISGGKKKGKDAAKIGGAASIGALIGGLAGGGSGAAIGAAIGGATGAGAVLATRGPGAVLPAETRIPFRLNGAITITERVY